MATAVSAGLTQHNGGAGPGQHSNFLNTRMKDPVGFQ